MVFLPFNVSANFLASLFGSSVSASSREIISQAEKPLNVQTISLLEPSVSLALDGVEEEPKVSDNALLPPVGLLRDSDDEEEKISPFDEISVYVVRRGDTLSTIAEMFGVSVNTIVWANDLKGKKIAPEDTLIILPVSGVKHIVKRGDTLASVAKEYKASLQEILDYNGLSSNSRLSLGMEILIPGGEVIEKPAPKPNITPSNNSSIVSAKNTSAIQASVSGYFAHPLPGSRRVRGLTRTHHGVDFAAPTGTPISASASGTVIFAKDGWNGAYGNLVIISHPNGTRTLYAHQSRIAVRQGESVTQGQVIGYVGNTGRSTGPHLHFEVLGAKNPF